MPESIELREVLVQSAIRGWFHLEVSGYSKRFGPPAVT